MSIACSRRTTFGDFRALVENVVSIPKDEQKIIFKGKKRTDKDETMFSAGVKNGSRLMVMHVPKASAATRSAASFASTSKRSASARSRARRKLREGGARGSGGHWLAAPMPTRLYQPGPSSDSAPASTRPEIVPAPCHSPLARRQQVVGADEWTQNARSDSSGPCSEASTCGVSV